VPDVLSEQNDRTDPLFQFANHLAEHQRFPRRVEIPNQFDLDVQDVSTADCRSDRLTSVAQLSRDSVNVALNKGLRLLSLKFFHLLQQRLQQVLLCS
jgi:hypothetical protein